jgi:tetratricopeptide (TPR) repeat protein
MLHCLVLVLQDWHQKKEAAMVHRFVVLACMFCVALSLRAQHEHSAASSAQTMQHQSSEPEEIGWVPREILDRPLPLRDGLGPVHEKVTTSSPDAQKYYDQGLAYLHSYVWIEAARSFNQALRLDPKMPMAYVGLSRTYSGLTDPKAAREALQKAQSVAAPSQDWEQRRIALRAQQLDAIDDIDNKAKLEAYRSALDGELTKRPNDIELLLIRGNAEEPFASGRGQFGLSTSVPFYDRVLKLQADNPAAHHYLVHTYEAMGMPEEAVKHGEVYARVTPSIAHAQHMYGHDLQKVNRNAEAVIQFQKAEQIEENYYSEEHIDVKYDWHHIHNLDLMSISHAFMGQMKDAEALWRQAFAAPPSSGLWEAYQSKWPDFLLERGRVQEALLASQKLAAGRWPVGRTMGHIVAGRALVHLNQLDQADAEVAAAEKEAALIEEVDPEPLLPHPRMYPVFPLEMLKVELALRRGQPEAESRMRDLLLKAKEHFRQADSTDSLFLLQLEAEDCQNLRKWELAQFAAEQMLAFDSNYAGGHYEMAMVKLHAGQSDAARSQFQKAIELWKNADPDLQELIQAKQQLAGLTAARN